MMVLYSEGECSQEHWAHFQPRSQLRAMLCPKKIGHQHLIHHQRGPGLGTLQGLRVLPVTRGPCGATAVQPLGALSAFWKGGASEGGLRLEKRGKKATAVPLPSIARGPRRTQAAPSRPRAPRTAPPTKHQPAALPQRRKPITPHACACACVRACALTIPSPILRLGNRKVITEY